MGTGLSSGLHNLRKRPVPILRIFFIVWVILWANFIMRDLVKKGHFNDYKILTTRDAQGKRSYTYGDYLFEFLDFCKVTLPKNAGYDTIGIKEISLDQRRAIYYLYPHVKSENANFLLVFDKPGFEKKGYKLFRKLDSSRFILKRI